MSSEMPLQGYEFVEEIAREVIDHSLDDPLYDQPIGLLTFRIAATAFFNPLGRERDCALTGRLYPKEVSLELSKKERRGYAAPWFMQSEFLVRGELEALDVWTRFLAPKAVTDLVSPIIMELQKAEMLIHHPISEDSKHEEKPLAVTNKEGKKIGLLSAKLQSSIRREGGQYRVTIRLENVSKVRSVYEAARKISYRSAHAFYAPVIVVKVRGNINRIITQDDPYADRRMIINCNCFTRRSKKGREIVFASPLIIVDRPVKSPVLAESSEAADGMDPEMAEVLRVIREQEKIEHLYKHQYDSLRIFSGQLSRDSGSKCIVSIVPTAFGKTLTACTMALYSALKGRGPGTKALLLFPTRILTIQQLTALAKYVYAINVSGRKGRRKITLGLYIGKGHREEKAYAPTQLITECPACGGGPLTQRESNGIAYPFCPRCEQVLDYIFLDDRDTQMFCPDIVVATPDKLAYELQRDPMSHVLVGAPMRVCGVCGRVNPALGGRQECAGCGSSLAGVSTSRSDIRFVFLDEFTLLSGMPSSRFSHFMRLLRRLKQNYGLNDDVIFLLACATAANPEEFASKFVGVSKEDVVLLRAEDYFLEERRPWQRVIVIYPWDLSTLGSVSWGCIVSWKTLEGVHGDQLRDYGKQLVYVQRRDDGHNLYDYIRRLGEEVGGRIGEYEMFFFHGDLKADELAMGKARAQSAKRGILIGTSTLGWGVHMPWLNVAHVWGAPSSTSEFFQVIGRVGRELGRLQERPALVVLHLYPGIPRDVWLYDNFISWFGDPSFEPEVIDPHNISMVRSVVPACFVSLLISRLYTKYQSLRPQAIKQCLDNDWKEIFMEAMEQVFLRDLNVPGTAGERLKTSFAEALVDYIQTARSRLSFRNLTEAFHEVTEFSLRGGESPVSYTVSGTLLGMLPKLKGQTVEEESLEEDGGTQGGGRDE
jgi:hypothetical protein